MVLRPVHPTAPNQTSNSSPPSTPPPSTPMAPKPLINLLRGWPSPSLLPAAQLLHSAHRVLTSPVTAPLALLYGPDPGFQPLRTALGSWLADFYGAAACGAARRHNSHIRHAETSELVHDEMEVETTAGQGQLNGGYGIDPERIIITGGASQNLGCILNAVTDPTYTRKIWIVAPGYFMAFKIFEDAGFVGRMKGVVEDEGGLDVRWLRREMRACDGEKDEWVGDTPRLKPKNKYPKIYKHIIYAVPSFSNPSARTMSLDRREELVRVAREFDALVVCDDVYDMLQWPSDAKSGESSLSRARLPRVLDVDRYMDGGTERKAGDGFGNVVSNGSFSKIGGPGGRTGWMEGTTKLAFEVSQTGTTKSGGAPSQLTSTQYADMLESGDLQKRILHTLQPAYASRYRKIMASIERYLIPLGVTLPQADRDVVGGYFLWLSLPRPLQGTHVAKRALAEENLIVAQGELFEVPGENDHARFSHEVRLCFAYEDEDALVEGVKRLSRVIIRMQRGEAGNDKSMVGEELEL